MNRPRLALSKCGLATFEDRRSAGEALGRKLARLKDLDPIVYALPRGGLPVAAAVAESLNAPLDMILIRKLGAPGHQELAIGAAVDGAAPSVVLNDELVRDLGIGKDYVERVRSEVLAEIERRRTIFAEYRSVLSPKGRVVILVDDGLATGTTMEAAVEAMRRAEAKRAIVAAPTASMEAAEKLGRLADEVIFLETPETFCNPTPTTALPLACKTGTLAAELKRRGMWTCPQVPSWTQRSVVGPTSAGLRR